MMGTRHRRTDSRLRIKAGHAVRQPQVDSTTLALSTPVGSSQLAPVQLSSLQLRAADHLEREADSHAQRFTNGPVLRRYDPASSPPVSRLAANEGQPVTPAVAAEIGRAARWGRPLDRPVRAAHEAAAGANFAPVRIHHDQRAHRLNQQVAASAFTSGRHIFFRRGAYAPHSQRGQAILAHELTHYRQQARSGFTAIQRLAYDNPLTWINADDIQILNSAQPVFRLSEANEPDIFVKFFRETDGSAERTKAADEVHRLAGLTVAQSRVYRGEQLKQLVDRINLLHPGAHPKKAEALNSPSALVMTPVGSDEFADLAEQRRANDQPLAPLFADAGFRANLGRMMAADLLLGNWDRLAFTDNLEHYADDTVWEGGWFHGGNFRVDAGNASSVIPIDNLMLLPTRSDAFRSGPKADNSSVGNVLLHGARITPNPVGNTGKGGHELLQTEFESFPGISMLNSMTTTKAAVKAVLMRLAYVQLPNNQKFAANAATIQGHILDRLGYADLDAMNPVVDAIATAMRAQVVRLLGQDRAAVTDQVASVANPEELAVFNARANMMNRLLQGNAGNNQADDLTADVTRLTEAQADHQRGIVRQAHRRLQKDPVAKINELLAFGFAEKIIGVRWVNNELNAIVTQVDAGDIRALLHLWDKSDKNPWRQHQGFAALERRLQRVRLQLLIILGTHVANSPQQALTAAQVAKAQLLAANVTTIPDGHNQQARTAINNQLRRHNIEQRYWI